MRGTLVWLLATVLVAAAPSAQGAVFVDVQIIGQNLTAPDSISGVLDLVNPGDSAWPSASVPIEQDIAGFDPAAWQATDAKVDIWVHSMDGESKLTVRLGSMLDQADQFSGSVFGFLPFEHGTILGANFLLDINSTGQLAYQLSAPRGSFVVDCVALEVWADAATAPNDPPPDAAVPEPISIIVWSLFGSLGVGICWWRRRRRD